MKKIYALFLTAMATLGANAQIVVVNNGEVCKPGETIVVKAVEKAIDLGDGSFWTIVECGNHQPVIKNEGSEATEVSVDIHVNAEAVGHTQCCFGGNCVPFMKEGVVTKSEFVKANSETPLAIEAQFMGGPEYYATYTLDFTVKANGKSENYTIKLVYDETCSGINNVIAENHGSKATYDISGRRVNRLNPGQIYIRDGKKFITR